MRLRATTAFAHQPAGGTRIECEIAFDLVVAADCRGDFAAGNTTHIEANNVVRATDVKRYAFACADVEHTYRTLKARGVEFDGEPQKQPWGTFAKFKDPDGNSFVLSNR